MKKLFILVLLFSALVRAEDTPSEEPQDEGPQPTEFNYSLTEHPFGVSTQLMSKHLGAQVSMRLFSFWTISIAGGGSGDGPSGQSKTNKTNPDIPHDYDYNVTRQRVWDASLVRDFWLGHSTRFTWFVGGGVASDNFSTSYDYYNINGVTRNEVSTIGTSETQTFLNVIGGFRYTELKTGFLHFPLMISAQLEIPLVGYSDEYTVISPEDKKITGKYSDNGTNVFETTVSLGLLF